MVCKLFSENSWKQILTTSIETYLNQITFIPLLQQATSQRNWLTMHNKRNISFWSLKRYTVEHNGSKDQSTWFLFVVGSESVSLGLVQANVSTGSDSQSSMCCIKAWQRTSESIKRLQTFLPLSHTYSPTGLKLEMHSSL